MRTQTHIYFFNPYWGGHYIEYVRHVLQWLSDDPDSKGRVTLSVLLPSECKEELSGYLDLPVNFHWLDEPLEKFGNVSKEKQIEILKSIDSTGEVDVVFFPHLERVRAVLQLVSLRNVECAGIMFSTFNRFGFPNENLLRRWYRSLRFLTGRLIETYQIFGRKRWRHVFLLNDQAAPSWYRRLPFLRVDSFSHLMDPIDTSPLPQTAHYSRSAFGLADDQPVVACVGDLRDRKNTHSVVEAFSKLAVTGKANQVQLLVVGSGDKEYIKQLSHRIEQLALPTIKFHQRYVSDEEFRWIVDDADVVAIPYLDFFRSSGVLNHAIQARTPVLCGNAGLIFEAVQQCGLGVGVNPRDPVDIANGIKQLTDGFQFSEEKIDAYQRSNDSNPSAFADSIFARLIVQRS